MTLPERAGLAEDPRTEVGRVGAALDTLLGHVEAALASRQESEDRLRTFIADASHELRTPLASIRGYAQLAQDDDDPEIQARSLDRIESEAERMGALVEDLLLLARLDAGQTLLHDPVDVSLLAIETAEDAHAAHPDHEWPVEIDESIEVPGDGHRLRQVLVNLLGNAGVHTPAGTRVTTSVAHDADRAVITVADDGPGIDPDLLPRLFDRFTRGDVARSRTGGSTGLGLSIAAAIVHAHNGRSTWTAMRAARRSRSACLGDLSILRCGLLRLRFLSTPVSVGSRTSARTLLLRMRNCWLAARNSAGQRVEGLARFPFSLQRR